MIEFIKNDAGGYLSKIKIENNVYLLLVSTEWFFPANRKRLTLLLRELYNNDCNNSLKRVLSCIINELIADRLYCTESECKRIEKNIEQIKEFKALYGDE